MRVVPGFSLGFRQFKANNIAALAGYSPLFHHCSASSQLAARSTLCPLACSAHSTRALLKPIAASCATACALVPSPCPSSQPPAEPLLCAEESLSRLMHSAGAAALSGLPDAAALFLGKPLASSGACSRFLPGACAGAAAAGAAVFGALPPGRRMSGEQQHY